MKKLMIGMLAAGAAIASAWAENDAVQFSTEAFENAAPDFTVAPWSYTGDADAELTIKTGDGSTTNGKYLELNTASKKLSLAPTAIGKYAVTNEVYFDSWVKFDAASDTIPEVGENDKLALFVLDDTDYIPETETPSKALYVIGGYMNGETLEKRLYKLSTAVDDAFLAAFKHISIKMYDNVMASGTSVPGFLIKVGDTVAQVAAAYTTDAKGAWVLGENAKLTVEKGEYLGAAIDPEVAASRYNSDKGELILGLDKGDNELNAVDFMGKGGIDALAFTNVKNSYGFEADAQLFTVDIPDNVVGVYADAQTNTAYKAGDKIVVPEGGLTLYVQLADGYYLNGATGLVPVIVGAGETLASNVSAMIKAALTVNGTAYAVEALGKVPLANGVSGAIVLMDNISYGTMSALYVTGNATLDLNGKTLGADGYSDSISVGAGVSLAISGAGTVNGNVTLADGATATIDPNSTAKFKGGDGFNTKQALDAMLPAEATKEFKLDEYGYYALAVKVVEDVWADAKNEVEGVTQENKAQVDEALGQIQTALGEGKTADDVATWLATVYPDDKKVSVAALVGAKNIDISVNFDLPLMQNDPVITVEASTVETPAEGQPENVAAFEFTITDGDAVGAAILTPATVEKVLSMVQYVDSLTGTWDGAGTDDVDTKISDNGKIKVQLKKKAGKNCGFMKLKLK